MEELSSLRLQWRACIAITGLLTPTLLSHLLLLKKPMKVRTRLALTLLLLPAYFVVHALLPLASLRALLAFTLCWVIPNKLLLLCVHNYSLFWPSWSFSRLPHFLLSILLPIRVKGPSPPSAHLAHSRHLRLLLYELSALVCAGTCLAFVPAHATYPFHFLSTFLTLDLPTRAASMAFHVLYRVELHAAFNNPWLPYSLTEFWGQRWNLTANALLRQSVYNPIIARLSARTGASSRTSAKVDGGAAAAAAAGGGGGGGEEEEVEVELWVRIAGVCATFVCSGLIHELVWFCILQKRRWASWENTVFFVLHGVATSAEISFRRLLPYLSLKVPRFLKLAFTLAFIHSTMAWLLFAPHTSMPKELWTG